MRGEGENILSDRGLDPSRFQPTYSGFLIDKLNKIYEAWDQGQQEIALARALRLCVFLPQELKKKLDPKKEKITAAINAIYKINDATWFSTRLARNKAARRVANLYLEPFVDEMVDWLDKRGFLEVPSLRLKAADFKGLEKDEG